MKFKLLFFVICISASMFSQQRQSESDSLAIDKNEKDVKLQV
jgi:hypothetical protein